MALLTNINDRFSVSDAGAVRFNDAFTFPTADGTANYVLQTNGSGQISWAVNGSGDISGSGTANKVTKFTGEKTIGDGPITFATNDSTFAGSVTATSFNSSSTTANIFLGSVITKPGDNLGFIVRNDSNAIIGSLLRTSNTASKLTADTLDLSGTTAQYVRGDGSFATYSPGTGTVTGSGTLNKVPRWTATGSNLGDGPITFATNDSTFAGKVTTDKIFVAKGQNVAHVTSSIIISQESTTKSQIRFYGADTSTAGILEFTGSTSDGSAGGARLTINADGSTTFAGDVKIAEASNKGQLFFGTANTDYEIKGGGNYGYLSLNAPILRFDTGGSERMRITSAGAIEIKGSSTTASAQAFITNDNSLLTIGSSVSGSVVKDIQFSSPSAMMYIDGSTSNVGIGTTSPDYKLTINNTGGADTLLRLENTTTNKYPHISLKALDAEYHIGVGGTGTATGYVNNFYVYDLTNSTPRITLTQAGNVGIGTQAPNAKLEVITSTAGYASIIRNTNGANDSNGLLVKAGTGATEYALKVSNTNDSTNFMVVKGNGNVGIGTTSPDRLLEISHALTSHEPVLRLTGSNNLGYAAGIEWQSGFGPKTSAQIFSTASGSQGGELWINVRRQATNTLERLMYLDTFGQIYFYGQMRLEVAATETNPLVGTDCAFYMKNTSDTDGNLAVIDFGNSTGFVTGRIGAQFLDAGDRNTDLYFMTRENGGGLTERMRILSNGNIGIGTTGPAARLNVVGVGQANNPVLAIDVTNSDSFNHGIEIFDGNLTTGETVLTAIGHSGATKLSAIFGFVRNENSLDQNLATIGLWGVNNLVTVSASGNVGIGTGTGTPAYKLDVQGTIRATGDVIAYSDVRVKENIKTIDNSLEKVSKLRGVEFNKIGNNEKSIGVIAQEIEKVIPEVVKNDDKGMKSVAYGNISGLLIEAIKELKAEIEELKSNKCNCNK